MRLIDADALIDDIRKNSESYFADDFAREWVDRQPTIEPERETGYRDGYKRGKRAGYKKGRERNRGRGEWTEKNVIYEDEADRTFETWQTARCSNCGKYHTTPYLYYFDNYNYCPNCGARMEEGEADGKEET